MQFLENPVEEPPKEPPKGARKGPREDSRKGTPSEEPPEEDTETVPSQSDLFKSIGERLRVGVGGGGKQESTPFTDTIEEIEAEELERTTEEKHREEAQRGTTEMKHRRNDR